MAKGAVIGALRVDLGLETAQFQDGLKNAQSSADKFTKAIKVTFLAVAAAATAAIGAIAVGVRGAMSDIDDMAKAAQKIGIPVEELSKLKYAADMSGVSFQGLQTSVGRLSRNMVDAAKGTGAGAEAFKRLGISVTDTDGRLKSSSEVMANLADKFANMPDGAQKTALAMEVMGKSGADMIPMLNGGSSALNELLEEAKAFGLEISESTGKAAEEFNDNLSRMGYAINGLTLGLTAALAPALVVVSGAMVQFTKWVLSALEYLPILAEYAAVAGGTLALMAGPAILGAIGNLVVAIKVGLVGAFTALKAAILANPLVAFAVLVATAVTAIYHFRDEIKKAIGVDVVGIVKDAANFVIGSFVAAFEDIKFVWNNFPSIIGAAVVGAANVTIKAIEGMVNASIDLLNKLADKANEWLPSSWQLKGLGNVEMGQFEGPDISQAVGDRNAAVEAAMSADYIGALGQAFALSEPAVASFATTLGEANDQITNAGGSAKAAGESMLASLEQLRQSLMTAEEAERNSYALRVLQIQEFYDAGLIQKAEYDELMERAHQEHTDRMAEITRRGVEEEMRQRGRLVGNISSIMGSLSSILESSGEKNLAASKAFAVAEAVINTAQGITKALAQGGMFGFVGAAAVAASGAAQIATILSASKGSAKRPGVNGSGGSAASMAENRSSNTVNLQIQGLSRNELYSGEQVRELMDRMVDMQRDGYQLVVVDP